jgi:two-component system cell cycle response regulator CtrA
MRVLLIEDDRTIAQSIELMLKSKSFNVYTTDLGEEGVDLGKLYTTWHRGQTGILFRARSA